ncbi:MAG: hypothetical protein K2P51_05340 [Rhabdochlamydiaceae bacterium]|nr:hypothetical protein [Rhabdochlamydiaceae bacterium]
MLCKIQDQIKSLEIDADFALAFPNIRSAARDAGVQNKMFGIFHDAGYKGLYVGLGADAIKARKGIDPKEQLMDRMGRTELAANQFRMTQTRMFASTLSDAPKRA